jgi:hypothetical protein
MSEFKAPTETIALPSKGLLYSPDSPLSKGEVEVKYMGTKEEDILTNQAFIKNGTVLDKLLQSVIVTPINYDDLLIGDKNAIMVAARVLGYGGEYSFEYNGETHKIDLSQIDSKPLHDEIEKNKQNNFTFTLPHSKNTVTFKLLTHRDEQAIQGELDGLKKINKDSAPELSTRLKYMITSVEGKTDTASIRDFVDNYLIARDSRALREYIREVQPDVDLTFFPTSDSDRVNIPIGLGFFWPEV